MVFRNLCVLVNWAKVASALKVLNGMVFGGALYSHLQYINLGAVMRWRMESGQAIHDKISS